MQYCKDLQALLVLFDILKQKPFGLKLQVICAE
jgi:hypothetical protein